MPEPAHTVVRGLDATATTRNTDRTHCERMVQRFHKARLAYPMHSPKRRNTVSFLIGKECETARDDPRSLMDGIHLVRESE
jgi:hypothetical protein